MAQAACFSNIHLNIAKRSGLAKKYTLLLALWSAFQYTPRLNNIGYPFLVRTQTAITQVWQVEVPAPLADMKLPGVVLLLLTSAAAVQYHWQAAVSLPGPAVQTTSAVSAIRCGLRCEALPPEECSGFIYEAGDGTCRLFSGDCRGPAADSPQQITDRYLGRNKCPGENNSVPVFIYSAVFVLRVTLQYLSILAPTFADI